MKQAAIVLINALLVLSACSPKAGTPTRQTDKLAEILARGTLVIATDADYAPQSRLLTDSTPNAETKCSPVQYTANQMVGFDVAVAEEIARRLGVEPCFVTPLWSQLVAGKWGDNWDIHVGSVAITLDRMKNLYFSQPYFATPTVILVHRENTTYNIPEDLSGRRIGVCVGCTFESYLNGSLQLPGQTLEYRIRDAEVVGEENEAPAIRDLSEGDGVKLDAVITLLPVATQAMDQGIPVRIMGKPLWYAYASITFDRSGRRDPIRLMQEVSSIISTLHDEGALKRLSLVYQGMDLTSEAAKFDLSLLQQTSQP